MTTTRLQGSVSMYENFDGAKYKWHSEKTKTTCEKCKSYDGKIFSKNELPELPVHPNCKCYVEPIIDVAYKKSKEKCDCREIAQTVKANLNNGIANAKNMQNSISKLYDAVLINSERLKDLKLRDNRFLDLNESFLGELAELKNNLKDFESKSNNLITDFDTIFEFATQDEFHSKSECKELEQIMAISNKSTDALNDLLEYDKKFHEIREKEKEIEQSILKFEKDKEMEDTRQNSIRKDKEVYSYNGYNPIGKNYGTLTYIEAKVFSGRETAGNLDLAHGEDNMNDPSYIKDAIRIENCNDPIVAKDRDYWYGKNYSQFKDYYYAPEEIPGYLFPSYSEASQDILNTGDFKEIIKEHKADIIKGRNFSVAFLGKGYKVTKESNLHNAIGMADIRNIYFDSEGNLHMQICDTYDFNKGETHPLVQAGVKEMDKQNLKPYFVIYDIIIPLAELEKLWQ